MTLYVCDRCKKQISRFATDDKYTIQKAVDNKKCRKIRTITLCQDCQEQLSYNLDHFLNDNQPTSATISLRATEDYEVDRTDRYPAFEEF